MRIAFRLQFVAAILTIAAGIGTALPLASDGPPQELVQFVHEAKKRGIKEDKIKQQAIAVGWPAATVDAAIAYDKSGKAAQPSTPEPTAAVSLAPQAPVEARLAPAAANTPAGGLNEGTAAGGTPVNMAAQDYQIALGDTLAIMVFGKPEVSVPVEVVRPDGKITVPLIKEVDVAGLTPKQVESVVTNRLGKFIEDANVSVLVTAMAVKNVYLTGAVKKEGPVPYVPGMTVLQALSQGGGLTDYAKRKKIYILRTENGREYRLDFNYDEVLRGERMEQNIVLAPNDTIVIPH